MLSARIQGFSLLEVIVVIIIISVLATLAIPNFNKVRERTLDQEAAANLKLISAAEKIYRLEISVYVACATTSVVNSTLRLAIPSGTTRNWDYKVDGGGATFTGKARRNGAGSRTWCFDQDDDLPSAGCAW